MPMRVTNGLAPPMPANGSTSVLPVFGAVWVSLEMNPKRVEQTVKQVLKIQPPQTGFLIGSQRL